MKKRHATARLLVLATAITAACQGKGSPDDTDTPDTEIPVETDAPIDADDDGVAASEDCDDADSTSTTLATDADCDAVLTAADCDDADPTSTTLATDADCDGTLTAADCDDTNPAISPTALEFCNGLDDNCDEDIDEGSALDALQWFRDNDGDSWGAIGTGVWACVVPAGDGLWSWSEGDCDDEESSISPDEVEVCNGIDDDCTGGVDDGLPVLTWYVDVDGDGFGGPPTVSCVPDNVTTVASGGDCDDSDALVYPGAPEICDFQANDCDTVADWTDHDEDGIVTFVDQGTGARLDVTADFHGTLTASPGDFYVCRGTWDVEVVSDGLPGNARVTLQGVGAGESILTGNHTHRVITQRNAGFVTALTISDLTLRDGWSAGDGGLVNAAGGVVSFHDVALEGGQADGRGGCMALDAGFLAPLFGGVTLDGCTASTRGGALYLEGGARLAAVTVSGSTAEEGGGVYVDGGVLYFGGLIVRDNQASARGGGLYLHQANGSFTGSSAFTGNTAEEGAGLYVATRAGASFAKAAGAVADVLVADNTASLRGGGMSVTGVGDLSSDGVVVDDNSAPSGAGLASNAEGTVALHQWTFVDNVAASIGGGVLVDDGSLVLSDGIVSFNQSQGLGGGLAVSNGAELTLLASEIDHNHADASGGGLYLDHASLTATDTSFTGDTASQYGGCLALAVADATTLTGGEITGCSAGIGGGISVSLADGVGLTLTGTTVHANTADLGGGVAHFGGLLTCDGGGIFGNQAASVDSGAGAWIDASASGASLVFDDCDLGGDNGVPDNLGPSLAMGQDVTVGAATWAFGAGTSVTCTQAGCP
jgi:hypothetical protein